MRRIIIVVFTALSINAFGQTDNLKTKIVADSNKLEYAGNDTIPQVSFVNQNSTERNPAYYINGKYVNGTIIKTINPRLIDSIRVEKQDVEIGGKKYYGQIYIRLKEGYQPKAISLTDLKLKYTNLANAPSIFMIDDEIISGDYSEYIVDEKYILKIMVEKVVDKEANLQVNMVRLLTKSEENIKKSKEIRIRGREE